jgi:hypothetical protein
MATPKTRTLMQFEADSSEFSRQAAVSPHIPKFKL